MESTKKKAIKGQGRPPSLFTEVALFLLCIQMSFLLSLKKPNIHLKTGCLSP